MAGKIPTMALKTSDFIPCKDAELRYVFIDQPGRENQSGKMCLNASIFVSKDHPGLEKLKEAIKTYWEENKPAGAPKKPKSTGISLVKVKKLDDAGEEVLDENDEPVYDYTGEAQINFWTGAKWPAKGDKPETDHEIPIGNAKGNRISLGGKKIGNGSFGSITGAAGVYDAGKGAQGVTLYLNAIQITKFVEYIQEAGFDAQEGDFEGVEPAFDEVSSGDSEAKPRL